ncbi:MAG: glycosyltransferase family 29 protein [Woeseiaceae bacterium]|nr:glycosyltransferase family 29 protein [Woeseiaceae bacterium]
MGTPCRADDRSHLPPTLARMLGAWRQSQGKYDLRTEHLWRQAWQHSGRDQDLLQLASFGRELGKPLPARLIDVLVGRLNGLDDRFLPQAVELLVETERLSPALIDSERMPRLISSAAASPPLGSWLQAQNTELSCDSGELAQWHKKQPARREAFADFLRDQENGICVVGNAANLLGSGLGRSIDGSSLVARFNRFHSRRSLATDFGAHTDIWVCSPRFLPHAAAMLEGRDIPTWLVLSGPDARYRRPGRPVDWSCVRSLWAAGVEVVTLPLVIWRRMVDRLGAPPSAGLLLLAWMHDLLGGWDTLAIAGFGGAQPGRAYHHAGVHHRASGRHAWQAERRLLGHWQREGLRVLGSRPGAGD